MTPSRPASCFEIFKCFFLLGLTSFGGPAAHIGYFRTTFVNQKQWLSEQDFAALVALSQVLPGPASSQVGFGLGRVAGGFAGACTAWLAFTLPSALFMGFAAYGLAYGVFDIDASVFALLKLIALVVVLNAVLGMAKSLCTSKPTWAIAAASAITVLLIPSFWSQPAIILLAAIAGALLCQPSQNEAQSAPARLTPALWQKRLGWFSLLVAVALFVVLPWAAQATQSPVLQGLDIIYRSASLVFGGGHVVLPLLHQQLIDAQLMDSDLLLAGYSLAQAIPGPIFTLAAFIGAALDTSVPPWLAATLCLVVAFVPGFVLLWVAQDNLARVKQLASPQGLGAFAGVNAAVVGLLFAALINPILLTSLTSPQAAAIAIGLYAALFLAKLPVWLVVSVSCAVAMVL
ncbi:MAG: chromate efflux transporter [Pontibacterium sp.]